MIIQRRMTNLNGQNIANNNQEHFLEYFKEKLNHSTKKNRSHKNMHSVINLIMGYCSPVYALNL